MVARHMIGSRLRSRWLIFSATCLLALTGGCGKSVTTTDGARPVTADEVIESMVAAYQSAAAYQDRGVVRLRYRRAGRPFEDETPVAVRFERPNRIDVRAYQVEVVCDGTSFFARIEDRGTKDFDGQIVQRPAPAQLGLADLYEYDEILALAFRQGLAGYPLQLDLLLGSKPLMALRAGDATRELLEPATLDGCPCERVRADAGDGPFVLWVDRGTRLLRKVEYPSQTFAGEIAEDPLVEDLELTAEFRGAQFAAQVSPPGFAMRVPSQAHRVRKFVPPPREIPSELIGKTTSEFTFADLAGQALACESLADRVKVFMWFNNHPACQSSVQQLNQVYQQYKAQPRVAIYAVCAEPSTVSDSQVRQLLQLWRVDLPAVRDLQAFGRDLFQIPWAPTLVVLNGQNVLQIFEVGANPNLVAELPQVLERLIAGEDLAAEILEQFQRARTAYEAALARGEPDSADDQAGTPVAAQTAPQLLRLDTAWTYADLPAAGNILALTDGSGDSRYLVHDGQRAIVELDSNGRLLARHALDLPESAGVSQLQSALDGRQRRYYVAWSLRGPQAYVFDDQWHRVLAYPPLDEPHEGVQDALLTDLNADGQLELCVGFWGTAGVRCVSPAGDVLWTNNSVSHVFSLADAGPEATPAALWVASANGQVVRLNQEGQAHRLPSDTGQLIHHLFRAPAASHATTPFCGIAYGTDGRRLALGLTEEPRAQWRYTLPAGAFPNQIRFVAAAPLLDTPDLQWLIAGPDGSLHIISQDGLFTDSFQVGNSLAGLAGGRHAQRGMLVVSTDRGVEAWMVAPPATAARK